MEIDIKTKEQTMNNGDYLKDGLIHCGKCHTPKEHILNMCGREKKVAMCCECEGKANDEKRAREEEKERRLKIDRMRIQNIQDVNARLHTFANDNGGNPKMRELSEWYADNFDEMFKENKGLIFYGDVGNGKTFFAHAIGNKLIDQGKSVMITRPYDIIDRLKSFTEDSSVILNQLNKFDLVIFDDLGVENQSEYVVSQIYRIINQRYCSNKPMIITTNLSAEEMHDPDRIDNKRIFDRLVGSCMFVGFKGKSLRRTQGEILSKEIIEMFNE